jgi:hypothetical protein
MNVMRETSSPTDIPTLCKEQLSQWPLLENASILNSGLRPYQNLIDFKFWNT